MSNEAAVGKESTPATWSATQVYTLAVVCLIVGLAIGYLFRGSQAQAPAPKAQPAIAAGAPSTGMQQLPSLDQMKHMADVKAQPLLEKLKTDPKNNDLLFQVGNIYKNTHQFKDAIGYYQQALDIDPKKTEIRTEMASCMYYSGDVDRAITTLQQSLQQDPKDANSLFNLGMIKWQGKQDASGALAAWQELLKSNPQLSAERRSTVEKMIAEVKQQGKTKLEAVSR
jgi:cytochrome c-type biogenesis protein CcmH/NrfG